jgi:NSS family neurotransmitter:Na+ symporter
MFFALLVFAALSSSISLIEPAISYSVEKWGLTRKIACIGAGMITWALGMGTVFSTNIWIDKKFFGTTFFSFLDYLSANIMLPLGGILIAVFTGWIMRQSDTAESLEISEDGYLYRSWKLLVCYVAPIAVGLVLLGGLF